MTNDELLVPKYEDLITHLYRKIKQMILDKVLTPGTKIKQEQLAQQLGVSRTPLIKALQDLSKESLVEYIPRRGFYVKHLGLDEMLKIFDVREVVEGVVAKSVAETATEEEIKALKELFLPFKGEWDTESKAAYRVADQLFHTRMVELSQNNYIKRINEMFNIYLFSYQKGLFRHPDATLTEHLQIIDALEKRDREKAKVLAMLHIENSKKNITNIYKKEGKSNNEIEW
jgi:DNA-binding GntR family transcriptional regulator